MIDSRAVVSEKARIGENVRIGAYAIVEDDVIIGDNTVIGSHSVIKRYTSVGTNNRIHEFVTLGGTPQSVHFKGERTTLQIGDHNTIREYVTINRGTAGGGGVTTVGNDNFIMAYCHIAHDCQVGNHVILTNASSLAGHAIVDDHAFLGGFVLVHQHCRIGSYTMVSLNTVCRKDVPPYMIVAGMPARVTSLNSRGLKQKGLSALQLKELKFAYKLIFRTGINFETAAKQLTELAVSNRHVSHLIGFLQSTKRGYIC